jgi:Host cell surface-exposed lipoprotein
VRSYEAAPDLVFEACRRALLAAGFEIQGADPRSRTIYFKRGSTSMSGSVQVGGDGTSTLSLVGASPDMHERVGRELESLAAATQAAAASPQASASSTELAADLERLGNLHERGLLTDEEFADAKARTFGKESAPPAAPSAAPEPSSAPSQPVSPPVLPTPSPPPTRSTPPASDEGGLQALIKRYWRRRSNRGKILTVVGLAVVGLVLLGAALAPSENESTSASSAASSAAVDEAIEAIEEAVEEAPYSSGLSSGQENARQQAESYLDYSAFSRKGLIEQLEFEGYSTADATYAVDNVTVDWNEQAALKAKDYLDYSSFSRSGLIEQLIFEGFTRAQAEYGVRVAY